jgi:outer membrane translocation and assembly module TamA
VQFGYIDRFAGLSEIPLAERFFAGGASTHRGFPSNQAGPRDTQTGFPLGGNVLLVHSTELRFPLIGDNLGGVAFHDMGNVFSDIGNVKFRATQRDLQDFSYMVHAVGFGIRYRTLVGPIRVDLAYAPNTPRFRGLSGDLQDFIKAGPSPDLCMEPGLTCVNQRISRFQFHFSLGQTF